MNQEQMNSMDMSLDEAPKDIRYAGFWMRLWAYTFDLIIVFSISGILLSPLKLMNNGATIPISVWTLNGILASLVFYIYFAWMTKQLGQTLGKMIFGLKVIRMDEQPLLWKDLLFREVIGRFIYQVFFFMNILYVIVAFNKEKQGIHDMIGNTKVIHISSI